MAKLIDSLTKAQEAKIPEYLERFKQIGMSAGPTDRQKAEDAIRAYYKYFKMKDPEFHWEASPKKGIVLAAKFANNTDKPTEKMIKAMVSGASYGSFEAYWGSTYAFIAKELPVEKDELIDVAIAIFENCGVCWFFENGVVMTEKPVAIHMKDGKLHNDTGLALEYSDGTGVFALNGTRFSSLLDMTLEKKLSNGAKE